MKFVAPRPFADPEAAARKLVELANAFEPVQDGRIYIEKINGPFLFEHKGTPAEYKAGLNHTITEVQRNWCTRPAWLFSNARLRSEMGWSGSHVPRSAVCS
jgi:hypothetical protein